jgi:hypothetical protein
VRHQPPVPHRDLRRHRHLRRYRGSENGSEIPPDCYH